METKTSSHQIQGKQINQNSLVVKKTLKKIGLVLKNLRNLHKTQINRINSPRKKRKNVLKSQPKMTPHLLARVKNQISLKKSLKSPIKNKNKMKLTKKVILNKIKKSNCPRKGPKNKNKMTLTKKVILNKIKKSNCPRKGLKNKNLGQKHKTRILLKSLKQVKHTIHRLTIVLHLQNTQIVKVINLTQILLKVSQTQT
jgi:hypothetical protein